MKLCLFPNDPIESYYHKGEIKSRYYNPKNYFDEIHIISLSDIDIDEKKVTDIAGDAVLKIHPVGKTTLINYKSKFNKIKKLVREISPDIIRSYNPLIQGWIGAKISKELGIPFVVSVHNNYDEDVRKYYLRNHEYLKYLKFSYMRLFTEPYVFHNASKIICVYRHLVPYVKNYGGSSVEVIYNRVYLSNFSPNIIPKYKFDRPAIIYVSRLDKQKNQQCLIRAIKDIDVKLILVGDGPDFNHLVSLAKDLDISEKIIFERSVPNNILGSYYTSATIFAAPVKQGGVGIPILEAMASGIPVITCKKGSEKEDVDDAITFVENTPDGFSEAITRLIENSTLRKSMTESGLEQIKLISGDIMEEKEASMYRSLLHHNRQT